MRLISILMVARRAWWALLLAGCLAGFEGYLFSANRMLEYEARSQLLVGPINTNIDTLRAANELAQTYAELATSRPLLASTVQQLRLSAPPDLLAKNVEASANGATRVLTIRVRARDGEVAARIATTLAQKLVILSKQGTSAPVAGQLQIIAAAQAPRSRVGSHSALIVLATVVIGAATMLTLLIVFERLNPNVRGRNDLAELAPVAFLGSVGGFRRRPGRRASPFVVESRPGSAAAAAYRYLAAKIESYEEGGPRGALLVIGVHDPYGSGAVAANLSAALTQPDRRVTLVDAQYDGEITELLKLERRPGVAELLNGDANTDYPVPVAPGLDVLPRGEKLDASVLEPAAARELLDRLLGNTDVLVLNGPPVDRSPATLAWAREADATLLVVRRGTTRREAVGEAVKTLNFVGANLIGTVLSER